MSISYAQNVGLVKTPPLVKIGNKLYRTVQIGNLIWMAENLAEPLGVNGINYKVIDGVYHYGARQDSNRADVKIKNLIQGTGFRLPTREDINALLQNNLDSLCATTGWNNLGTNTTTLNLNQANVCLLDEHDHVAIEATWSCSSNRHTFA